MLINLIDTDYSHATSNYIHDIETNYKYLESFRMTLEASVLLDESFTIDALNEAVGEYWDKFKAKIKAFITAIKELWTKFWSKIENKVMSDVEWLNNYSKALLKMTVPDLDYTMYGYFEQSAVNFRNKLLGNNLIPTYNPNDTKLFEALESSDKFRSTYLPQFQVKDMSFNEGVKYKCRGDMEDPKSYGKANIQTNLSSMVEYCLNYPKLARTLETEKNRLERDLDRITRDIDKIKVKQTKEPEVKEEPKKDTKDTGTGTGDKGAGTGAGEKGKGEVKNLGDSYNPFLLVEGARYYDLPFPERIDLFNEGILDWAKDRFKGNKKNKDKEESKPVPVKPVYRYTSDMSKKEYITEVNKFLKEYESKLRSMIRPYSKEVKKYDLSIDIEDGILYTEYAKALNFTDDYEDANGEKLARIIGCHSSGETKFYDLIAPAFKKKFGFALERDGGTDFTVYVSPHPSEIKFKDKPMNESYQEIFKSLLHEAGGVKISGETDKKSTGAVYRGEDGKIASNIAKEVDSNDSKEDIAKRYSVFMTEVYNIIGLRMTVAEEVYTTYMQILRYLGSEFTKKDRASKAKVNTNKDGEKEENKEAGDNKGEGESKEEVKDNTAQGATKRIISSFKSFFGK